MGAAVGQIGGAIVGGMFANSAAKKQAAAQDRATQMQMQPYLDAQPYIRNMYSGGTDALNSALDAGYYSGPTYADLSGSQRSVLTDQLNYGQDLYRSGAGFGNNYASLYGKANSGSAMNDAINYATNNSKPLIDAAMRGADRQLNEVALQNLNHAASSSGNTRNSRSGVAEAILRRDYGDTYADTAAGINNSLMRDSLNQSNRDFSNALAANRGLAGAFNTGFTNAIGAGSAFQKDLQNTYTDAKNNFEGNRDFAFDMYGNYNSNVLGRAPQSVGQVKPNLVDPTAAALGGAQMGMGWGQKLANYFGQGPSSVSVGGFGPNVGFGYGGAGGNSPYLYGDGYLGGD